MTSVLKKFILFFVVFLIVTSVLSSIVRAIWGGSSSWKKDHVRVVTFEGVILDSIDFVKKLEEIEEDDSTKAVVLRINSPGGVVGPSQEIYHALKRLDKKKPVVASLGAVAASGGYYIAIGAREIFANHGTLTGSIGVIMEFMNSQKLYDWAKLKRFNIKTGAFKDIGSSQRPMRPDEKELLEALVQDIQSEFKKSIVEQRKLKPEQVEKVADGRIFSGNQAQKLGLVDHVGGLQDAIAHAKKVAKLDEKSQVRYPEKDQKWWKALLQGTVQQVKQELNPLLLKDHYVPTFLMGY